MMSNETQLQKAIKIAVKDGWVRMYKEEGGEGTWFKREITMPLQYLHKETILKYYTTDLNYLMPIAVKVFDEIEQEQYNDNYFYAYANLHSDILTLTIDTNKQYTELFESLYEAIKLLGDE